MTLTVPGRMGRGGRTRYGLADGHLPLPFGLRPAAGSMFASIMGVVFVDDVVITEEFTGSYFSDRRLWI